MKKFVLYASMFILVATLAAWAGDDKPAGKAPATSPGFEAMKKLVGDWTAPGPDGKPIETNFRLSAGGSILVETLFPGKAEEMVTIYHMDGNDLILTHYCMLGNQPRLKAASPKETKKLTFKSVGGTNMKMEDMHMGQATFTLTDNDHYQADWCACTAGKPDEAHCTTMVFTRKK